MLVIKLVLARYEPENQNDEGDLRTLAGHVIAKRERPRRTIQGITEPVHDEREESPDGERDIQQALGLLPMAGRTSCFV